MGPPHPRARERPDLARSENPEIGVSYGAPAVPGRIFRFNSWIIMQQALNPAHDGAIVRSVFVLPDPRVEANEVSSMKYVQR